MDKKNIFQYGLLILLFVVCFLFYYKYFFRMIKSQLNQSENIIKKAQKLIKMMKIKI